jgi:predicted protein tyrosine phosphatase
MPPLITIMPYSDAQLYQQNYTHVLSLTEFKPSFYSTNNNFIHWGKMDDSIRDMGEILAPTMQNLKNCLEFTKNLTSDDKLLIHCHAGVSRSTAIAVAVLIQHEMDFNDAFNYVLMIRDCAIPNKKIVELTDRYFELKNMYVDFYKDWAETEQKDAIMLHKPSKELVDDMQTLINKIIL